ncbi:MAG: hypothetical protein V6Z89_00725 [Desulfobacter sp.]
MRILVCIKPHIMEKDIGPFESIALEAGLQLGEEGVVDVITAGPDHWVDTIYRALGMGADNGIHILTDSGDPHGGLVPASVTAGMLSAFVMSRRPDQAYDLIITGVMSQDLMAGQTGPMTAAYLDIPCVTAVVRAEQTGESLLIRREWEGGYWETLEMGFPALISIQAGQYTPRYPALSHMLKAKDKPLTVIRALSEICSTNQIPGQIPKERFSGLRMPEQTRKGEVVRGTLADQVRAFETFLQERNLT